MKKIIILVLAQIIISSLAYSQLREGDNLLGGSIGLYTTPGVPTFGLNYENQVTRLGDVASLGLGAVLRYTTWRDNFPYSDYNDYNYLTIGGQVNVNFNDIGEGKFVPFVGAVLGYNNVNNSYVSNRGVVYTSNYSSGLWLWGQAGFRYFFSPKFAGGIRIGAGNFNFNTLELSFDFKL
jgi:hypothetical protein